jgi:2-hydroxychromene-2-carboxylate isomerase
MRSIIAWHFTDPACPWAYSARPAHARLRWRFGDQLDWRIVLIGLAASEEEYLARGYTPGGQALSRPVFRERFGMPFAAQVKERVAGTAVACRALVVVREEAPERVDAALRALQFLSFTNVGLLDDPEAIRDALEPVAGVDAGAVVARLDDPDIVAAYETDRARARAAEGSPTQAQDRHSTSDGPVRYTAPSILFEDAGGRVMEAGGFQPFEGYDLALANLDPTLERRPAPQSARETLAEFPDGLTTAEVAVVRRPSDLVDADLAASETELLRLMGEGAATREAIGHDAVWRLR